jgi:hypothetical protein
VFWREGDPWVLLHCTRGMILSIPWGWTNLPKPWTNHTIALPDPEAPLLSPAALRDLARFVRLRSASPPTETSSERDA